MRYLRIIAVALLLMFPRTVGAMEFAPTATDIVVMPGEEAHVSFTVTNTNAVSRNFAASLYGVQFDTATDDPVFQPLSSLIASWASLDAYNFSIAAGGERAVTLTVAPPASIVADSFVMAVVVRELTDATSGASVASGVSGLVFATVGAPDVAAHVTAMRAAPRFAAGLPIDITVEVENTGERVAQPSGSIAIYNTFGGLVAEYDLNPLMRRIPAGQSRFYTVTWDSQSGSNTFFAELWRELVGFKVGVFTAELSAAPYPGGDALLIEKTRVVVIPWRVLLAAGVVCTAVAFARRARRK